jgi:glutaredoxin
MNCSAKNDNTQRLGVPVLYVKSFCPWCAMAEAELKRLGVRYERIDVSRDGGAFEAMIRLSGQTLTPTLAIGDRVLSDFGPEELQPFLTKAGLPEK